MNAVSRSHALALSFFGTSLIALVVVVLVFAGSAAAGPQVDSMAFLPFVSSPQTAVEIYETDFTNSIEPWKAVRWQKGAAFDVDHNGAGYLDVEVNTNDTYVIVSPLILGPSTSYDITFRAKLDDRKDKAQYGVIYGADWNGGACPGDNTNSCFNQYYEFRVRYRDDGIEKFLEYRIRRVDGHDGNNIEQGTDLVEWTRATNVNAEDWNKWEVHYGESGHMSIKANNSEQAGSARDNTYDGERYFGVYARAGENGDTEASFDNFKIVKES